MSSNKISLIYVYDPLCGWCFGFYPVMEKLQKRFENKLTIEVKPGGLATGDRARTIEEGYGFIKNSHGQVEKITGVEFGRNFKLLAEEGSYMVDSMPPCRAQVTMNELHPDQNLRFAGAMQKALFKEGKSLNEWKTYRTILDEFQLDADTFRNRFESEEIKQKTLDEFEWCRSAGASGFPTLLLKVGDEMGVMARGYRPFDTIESHLHHIMNNFEKLQGHAG